MPTPWLGMLFVLLALGGLLGGLALLQKHYPRHPELIRKLLHIGMGLVTLSFPWLFNSAWPVVALAISAIGALLGIKWLGHGKTRMHSVVHGVARNSLGEIYFPIAVCLLFVLSAGNTFLFVIPVLILTLADAVAALIGVRYGKIHYTTAEGVKSTEGSIAFFIVAFMSVHIPLLLFTDIGREETLLIALILGVLVMLLEALAWRGLDNLFIPLGSYLLLKVYMTMESSQLLLRLLVSLGLLAFVILWRKRTPLQDNAALAGALIAYLAWAAGDWHWFLPIALLCICYTLLSRKHELLDVGQHDARAVIAVTLPGMLWLFLARSEHWPSLYYPYAISFAIQVGLICLTRLRWQQPDASLASIFLRCIGMGSVSLLIPLLAINQISAQVPLYLLPGIALITASVITFNSWQLDMHNCPTDTARWWRQTCITATYSTLSLLIIWMYPPT